ncbi:MAG TPA: methylated-DNA--[protein]-cysteine S-methyltransferase [Longimicrobium sp.]|jgi:methylated-DNA-[protein]-cysteine S-methyltransferase|uniref:methylated-DNA--[protein]-cysteine S-methyltransferase n=1 Tax=Longimicrobium sp. TaxID=2029185 RepID=UPI002EDB7DAF
MTTYASSIDTPVGPLTAVVHESGALTHLLFAHQRVPADAVWDAQRCAPVAAQMREYFAGERTDFDLPLAPAGSAFQQQVWRELRGIGFGVTAGYGALAVRLGRAGSARAVGRANATNPIPIVIPCHRVVGSDGCLTGYAGGMEMKMALLRLEGIAIRDGRMPRLSKAA